MTDVPRLPEDATPRDAVVWVRAITKRIGPGFHPDTLGADYVSGPAGTPTFTPAGAAQLDRDLYAAFSLLEVRGRNPYDVAIKVQRRLLGIPRPGRTC